MLFGARAHRAAERTLVGVGFALKWMGAECDLRGVTCKAKACGLRECVSCVETWMETQNERDKR